MVGFSKKTQAPMGNSQGNTDPELSAKWTEFKQHQWDIVDSEEEKRPDDKHGNLRYRKTKTAIGIIKLIMDLGFPKPLESDYDMPTGVLAPEGDEKYSPTELEYLENPKHKGRDFKWLNVYNKTTKKQERTRRQTSEGYRKQEYGVAVDIPSLIVDYGLHPSFEGGEKHPVRISLNGTPFFGEITPRDFERNYNTGVISETNFLRKVARASGIDDELVANEFDIGTFVDAACNYKIVVDATFEKNEDGSRGDIKFIDFSASTPSKVETIKFGSFTATKEDQIKDAFSCEGLTEFTGILLNESDGGSGYKLTTEMLNMLGKKDKFGWVKRASSSEYWEITGSNAKGDYCIPKGLDYETSDFAKAYKEYLEGQGIDTNKPKSAPAKKAEDKKDTSKPEPKKEPKQQPAPVYNEPPIDFDDDQL